MRIALIGGPQTGKTELEHVFRSFGIQFVNLNDAGDRIRSLSSPMRPMFEAIAPGGFDDNGKRLAAYYHAVALNPGLLQKHSNLERPAILAMCRGLGDGAMVISWEYIQDLLLDRFPVDHVIVLRCQQTVWLKRLRQRSKKRGWTGPPPNDVLLLSIMRAIRCLPDDIDIKALPCPHTIVDTSLEDWGEANLRRALVKLGFVS